MFFFGAYDGYRDRRQTASVLTSIPTLAERNDQDPETTAATDSG